MGYSVGKFSQDYLVKGSGHETALVIELVGDLGAGKTQFVRGLAIGAGSADAVQSPTFTISRVYRGEGITIYHFDLYRLGEEPGIIAEDLKELINDQQALIVTEWAEAADVLPPGRIRISITVTDENERKFSFENLGDTHTEFFQTLEKDIA